METVLNQKANKKYSLIYADPPWEYNVRNNTKTKFAGGAMAHYPVMKTADICVLPVHKITADNCALIIWVTFPKLVEGLSVIKAWGFRYVTVAFSWFKTTKDGKPFFGVGYYSKSNSEIALLGIKGKMKPVSNFVSQVIISERQQHSKKPDIVRNKIVELFGDLSRVELFARQRVSGWDTWGNEIPCDIEMGGVLV